MGELLRSELMSFYQAFLPTESAYFCVAELAELGLTQFKDVSAQVVLGCAKLAAQSEMTFRIPLYACTAEWQLHTVKNCTHRRVDHWK